MRERMRPFRSGGWRLGTVRPVWVPGKAPRWRGLPEVEHVGMRAEADRVLLRAVLELLTVTDAFGTTAPCVSLTTGRSVRAWRYGSALARERACHSP